MIAPDKPLTRRDCPDAITHDIERPPFELLRAAAEALGSADEDTYGDGTALNAFERKLAAVLRKDAAVFMPSGTMAQQIALRIAAERSGRRGFAGHATNHVVLHEHGGYARLHGLHFVPAGSATLPLGLADIRAIREAIGTLLLELPQRELGGELPPWDELVAMAGEARSRGWHLHLDGARLWECGPAYARPYAEIADLFDSVYVSLYKGIGGLAGAVLAGSAGFIDEARVWQRRHGGNLKTLGPYAAVAEYLFDERLARMTAYRDAAVEVARALKRYPGIRLRPDPPPTNMFHAFVPGTADELLRRAQRVAREHGVWTFGRLAATGLADVQCWEISCGEAVLTLTAERLRTALDGLFLGA